RESTSAATAWPPRGRASRRPRRPQRPRRPSTPCEQSIWCGMCERRQGGMRLRPGNSAPLFVSSDVYGRRVSLVDYAGWHVLLSFYRAAVCPLCSLRFALLVDRASAYARQGLAMVAVFESSPPETLRYMRGLQLPIPVIGNVAGDLF